MIASLTLALFIIVYVAIFLFHPSLFIIVPLLLLQASLIIVLPYKKSFLLLFIISQGVLFIPYLSNEETKQQNPLPMYGKIISLKGEVIFDSTLSESGNRVVSLHVREMKSAKGVISYVHKNIITIIRNGNPILGGTHISVDGHFFIAVDGTPLFMSNSYEVMKKQLLVSYREKIHEGIVKRIKRLTKKHQQLVLLLALGIKGEEASTITKRAVEKGVAHLFALSGMHLSILLSLFLFFFSSLVSKQKSRLITLFIALLYVWIAGNKPSLVRSLLFLVVSVVPCIPSRLDRFIIVILLHSILFPNSMMTLAAIYSYSAIYSIIVLVPIMSNLLSPYFPSFLYSSSSLTISAMSITGCISLILFNAFTPTGFVYTHLLTPIIMLLLISSILYIMIPIHFIAIFVEILSDFTFTVLEKEVEVSLLSPIVLYTLFLIFLLTLILLLCYSQKVRQSRSAIAYEMDISLRIKLPNKSSP